MQMPLSPNRLISRLFPPKNAPQRVQLQNVGIASPCPADWERMVGDNRVRYCSECKLNVYNLSELTRREAEDLIAGHEGRLMRPVLSSCRRNDSHAELPQGPAGRGSASLARGWSVIGHD
jgi:hypothetical protein